MGQSVNRIDLPISGSGGVSKAYVDNAIADINDVTTTLVAGDNVSIVDNGTDGDHIYTVSATGGGGGDLPADFSIDPGDNIQVGKNGNTYTISATDTVTTVVAGDNINVAKSANNYHVNLKDKVVLTDVSGRTSTLEGSKITVDYPNTSLNLTESGELKHDELTIINKREDGTHHYTSVRVDRISVGDKNGLDSHPLILHHDGSGYNEIIGLDNKTWDGNYTSGRAATEDQLKVLADRIAALEARI